MLEKLKGKRLLILGGVSQMVEVVNRAHEYGIQVYVTDYLEDSPCKKVADKSFMINALDTEAVAVLCKKEQIDGIITGYVDMLLPYYAEICEKVGLPSYGTKEQFEIITNKKQYKKKCMEYGVPTPKVYTEREIAQDLIHYPVIVKPADSSGSRGVSVCYTKEELDTAIGEAISFSQKGGYVIEDYMTEGNVLIHYYLQDGNPIFVGMCDRFLKPIYEGKPPTNICKRFPSQYTNNHLCYTDEKMKSMFRGLSLQNGLIEIEAYIRNGIPYAGDIGYRICGSRLQYMFNKTLGIFSPDLLIHFALTGKMADYDIQSTVDPYLFGANGVGVDITIKPGKIKKIIGIDELNRQPFIAGVIKDVQVGDTIAESDIGKLKTVALRSFAVAKKREELSDIADYIYRTIDFIDENNQSMKLPTNDYYTFLGVQHKPLREERI